MSYLIVSERQNKEKMLKVKFVRIIVRFSRPSFFSISRLRARSRLFVACSSNSASDFGRRFALVFTYPICLNSSRLSICKFALILKRAVLNSEPRQYGHENLGGEQAHVFLRRPRTRDRGLRYFDKPPRREVDMICDTFTALESFQQFISQGPPLGGLCPTSHADLRSTLFRSNS
jgi:hypothetical protein